MTDETESSAQLVTEIVVPDLAATLAMLVALGFCVERNDGGFAVLRWEEAFLFVAEDQAALVEHRWTNVRVIVPDADVMLEKARRLGVQVVNAIGDRSYGLRDCIVRVPGGVGIRFAQILAASPQ